MTVHSDWADWLPRAIETSEPTGVDVWYLGCNGVVLKAADGTVLFIDPYFGTGDPPRTVRMVPVPMAPRSVSAADAILTTHEHTDHVHGPSQAPLIERTGATFYGADASIAKTTEEGWVERWSLDAERFVTVAEGDAVDVGSFTVHVEPAYDPDAVHPISYVIEHAAGTFLHPGDSKPDESLAGVGARYDIDLGVAAFGSSGTIPDKETGDPSLRKWYADADEVIDLANLFEVDRLLPTHWDMWKGLTADPTDLFDYARGRPYPLDLEILEIGDRTEL